MGNQHRHTVQCFVNPNVQSLRAIPAEMNTSICFTMASLLLIHLLYTLVVSPMVNRLTGAGGKKTFILDLNLAATLGMI